jgi:hypothetical protein
MSGARGARLAGAKYGAIVRGALSGTPARVAPGGAADWAPPTAGP